MEHDLAGAREAESLLADTGRDGQDVGAGGKLLLEGGPAASTWRGRDGAGLGKERDGVDHVVHGLPAIRATFKVVAARMFASRPEVVLVASQLIDAMVRRYQ